MTTPTDARTAARRLHRTAGVMRLLGAVVFGVAAAVGLAVALLGDSRSAKIGGGVVVLGSAFAWLALAVLCAAGQAVARYIEVRVQ